MLLSSVKPTQSVDCELSRSVNRTHLIHNNIAVTDFKSQGNYAAFVCNSDLPVSRVVYSFFLRQLHEKFYYMIYPKFRLKHLICKFQMSAQSWPITFLETFSDTLGRMAPLVHVLQKKTCKIMNVGLMFTKVKSK